MCGEDAQSGLALVEEKNFYMTILKDLVLVQVFCIYYDWVLIEKRNCEIRFHF